MHKIILTFVFAFSFITFAPISDAAAQGFSTLKSAGQGLNKDAGGKDGDKGGKKGSSKKGETKGPSPDDPAFGDVLFIGQFEKYLPAKRFNARITVFAEANKFIYSERTCQRTVQVRDRINTYLFQNPPKVDNKGRVDTAGMEAGISEAIQKGIKSKRTPFHTIHVISGRFNMKKKPSSLADRPVKDCAGVIELAKELKEAKK